MKKIGDAASKTFSEEKDLIGVIIGGPGPTKEDFENGEFLHQDIKSKVIGVVNTSYTGDYGLREMVSKAEDLIAGSSITREKKILERFFEELHKDSGLAVYGFCETLESLKSGNVEILLISEAFDWIRVKFECPCGENFEKVVNRKRLDSQKCPKCGKRPQVLEEEDLMEKMLKMAEDTGAGVEVISDGTGMGEQLKEIGGIAGILRYKA